MKFQNFSTLNVLKKTNAVQVIKVKDLDEQLRVVKLHKKTIDVPYSAYLESISHPNIVRCYSSNEITLDGVTYIMYVLEWVNGESLREYLNQGKELKSEHIFQILYAVQYIHKQGIVHGDIKPENILIKRFNESIEIKMSDYNTQLPDEKVKFITPEYSSPEFNPKNASGDVWSLGCLFYELFFKKHPFGSRNDGTTIDVIMNNILRNPIPERVLKLPEPFRYVIFKSLRKKEVNRFRDIEAIIKYLTQKNLSFKQKLQLRSTYMKAVITNEVG